MPSAQNKIQIVDTHETSETLAVTRLQRVGYQINRTLLKLADCWLIPIRPPQDDKDTIETENLPFKTDSNITTKFLRKFWND